jgi:hypothetical protein
MQNNQNHQVREISVSAMISASLESRLHSLAALNHKEFGLDYADTFAQVIALGIDSLQVRRSAAFVRSADMMKRVRG